MQRGAEHLLCYETPLAENKEGNVKFKMPGPGCMDRKVLIGGEHLNFDAQILKSSGPRKRARIAGALKYLGLEFEGTHSCEIDDAKNIARIARHVCSSS